MKHNRFRGDLTDNSAKAEALLRPHGEHGFVRCTALALVYGARGAPRRTSTAVEGLILFPI